MVWFAFLLGGIGILYVVIWHWLKMSRLPPGPRSWPILGNVLQMDSKNPHHTWSKWAAKYQDVCTINTFGNPHVFCNSYEANQELLVSKSKAFAGRPQMYPFRYVTDGGRDIANLDINPDWEHKKKVFITGLKMYGDGQQRLENIMSDIIKELVEDFQQHKEQPFDPKESIQLALLNTLSLLLLGDKFEQHDSDFRQLLSLVELGDKTLSPSPWFFALDMFPWLHYLPLPYCRRLDAFFDGFVKDWIPRQINHKMHHYSQFHLQCVLDVFIKQHKEDMSSGAMYPIDERDLVQLVLDYFFAGMTTSTSTLYTMFAVLVAKPDIQKKAREEVDQVLGSRIPTLKDKEAMPYFQALLEEVFRNGVVATAIPHKAMQDETICGHFIPKGTSLMPNMWHLSHDPDFWEDPFEFKPERFLDDSGHLVPVDHPARKRVMIFGAGRRVCAGEQLARNRIFLLTTSLLQRFVFEPAADDKLLLHDPRTYAFQGTINPQPYQIQVIQRK